MRRFKKIFRGTEGSEIAEAALVLPIAFMILLAIYWFGRAFNIYGTINHAAREGAQISIAQTCADCGNAAPLTGTIATRVTQALQASHIDPTQILVTVAPVYTGCSGAAPVCSSSSNIWICTNVQMVAVPPGGSGAPACGTTVDFQYPYQMVLPFTSISNQAFKLPAHVQMRSEQ
jgi:hypothetical protein